MYLHAEAGGSGDSRKFLSNKPRMIWTAVSSELTFYILPSFLLFPCERVNIILFINLEFNGSEYLHGEVDSCAEIQGNSW